MQRLLALLIGASILWGGWWFIGSSGVKTAFEAWFDERRAAGWVADYSDLSVQGFPNRFDTTLTDLHLADPGTAWAWQAPFLQLLALSYQPNHVIAVFPPEHLLASPAEKIRITSADTRASLKVDASTRLALDKANLVADTLTLTQENGDATSMTALRAAIERTEGTEATYRIGLNATDLSLPGSLRRLLGASDSLPRTFSALQADLTATFSRPWDLTALETNRPQPTALTLTLAEARWGDLEIAIAGKLAISEGVPEGQITFKAKNWREILNMAQTAGALPESLAKQAEGVLGMLARANGNPNTLDLPLDLKGGYVFVGPIPVAPAPKIILR